MQAPETPRRANDARWQRVEELCDAALRLKANERDAFLAAACGGDAALRQDIESLLAHETAAERFLASPATAATVRALAGPIPDTAVTRLGDYELGGRLGEGGMGVVYRAHDTRLDRDVALKLLATGTEAPETTARLRAEARAAARLNHPNICTVFEVAVTGHAAFIAMELVEGQALRAVIPPHGWPIDRVCDAGRQIADALEHAHAHGVIHRDLKSSNVMLRSDGRIKVIDFGIAARAIRAADQTETQPVEGRGVAGTLAYLAPELLQGGRPGVQSDLWSLGVLLYEMTTGRLPFDKHTDADLAAAILRDPPPRLPSTAPPPLARLIERCLAKNPEGRPARAAEVADALDSVAALSAATTSSRSSWIPTLGGVAVIAIAAIAIVMMPRTGSAPEPVRFEHPVQITGSIGVEDYPAWSRDGLLAFAASPTGHLIDNWDIWVIQPGGAPINRTEGLGGRNLFPVWSPDGSQISFWSSRDGGGCYVMPALAGGARRVSPASEVDPNPPQWSADGSELSCVAGVAERAAVNVVSIDTGQTRRSIELPGTGRWMFVTESPDRTHIAFVAGSAGLDSDISQLRVFDFKTRQEWSLTDGRSKVWSPQWSRDGRSLYYVSYAGATMDVWQQFVDQHGVAEGPARTLTTGIGIRAATISSDGRRLAYSRGRRIGNAYRVPYRPGRVTTWSDAQQLTFDQASVQCLDLDRSGTRLALSSDRSGSFDLWTMPAAGGAMIQLTSDPSAEWCPAWSPDNKTLAFFAYRSGNRDIWTVPAAGGEWTQITTNDDSDLHPSWSPDGLSILYLSRRSNKVGTWISQRERPDQNVGSTLGGSWSPVDNRMIAQEVSGAISIVDLDGRAPDMRLTVTSPGGRAWSHDGRSMIFRAAADRLDIIEARADALPNRLVDLSGRRGSLGVYSMPSDGKFLYFIWEEDLGDIWTMGAPIAR